MKDRIYFLRVLTGASLLVALFLSLVAFLFAQAAPKMAAPAHISSEKVLAKIDERQPSAKKPPTAKAEQVAETSARMTRDWTEIEIVLSGGILVFGLCCLGIETLLILRSAHHNMTFDSSAISRMTGLTLIVTSSLVLVTAGYSTEQIGPVMGLLGTIAGYLLGSGGREARA